MVQKKWIIKYSPEFTKEWKKIDPSVQGEILSFFSEKLRTQENPKLFAKSLSGNLKNFWRYRIRDHRVICAFNEKEKVIYIVRVAHRSKVYKNVHSLFYSR